MIEILCPLLIMIRLMMTKPITAMMQISNIVWLLPAIISGDSMVDVEINSIGFICDITISFCVFTSDDASLFVKIA